MALPSNISYGTVTGAFLRAVADSPVDQDRDPEGLPVADLVLKFTADLNPAIVRDMSASPPVTILIDPVPCVVNASGILVGPDGQPGVRLVASTDPDTLPTNWTWTVAISSPTFPALSFSFPLDPGATVDLATVVQVPSSPGTTLDAWLAAVAAAQAAQAAAEAAATRAETAAAGGGGSGGSGSAGFQYTQASPAATWTVPHSFGRRPSVDLFLSDGTQVLADVTASASSVSVSFPSPTAGFAVLT